MWRRNSLFSRNRLRQRNDDNNSDREDTSNNEPVNRQESKLSKIVFLLSLILSASSLILAGYTTLSYWQNQQQKIRAAKRQAQREAVLLTLEIERQLREFQKTTVSLSNTLSLSELTEEELSEEIEEKINGNQDLLSLGVAYNLFGFDQNRMLYAPGFIRLEDEIKPIQLEDYYDYTKPQYDWFRKALKGKSHWGEPYSWGENNLIQEYIFGFYSPFYQLENDEKIPVGVIYSEYSKKKLQSIVESLNLGKTGYGFLLSKNGVFIAHPNQDHIKGGKKFIDILEEQNNRELIPLVNQAFEGEKVVTEFVDEITGQKSWLFLQPMALNGWVVGIVFLEQEILLDSDTKRQRFIWNSLAVVSFFFFLSIIIFKAYTGKTKNLWAFSSFTTFLFMAEIGFIWNLALAERNYLSNRFLVLTYADLDNILKPQVELTQALNQAEPLYIPTGILVKSLDFSSPKDIFITGYIWQRYTDGIHDDVYPDVSPGVIFPNEVDLNQADDYQLREVYRHKSSNVEIIGWYFEFTFRQRFDFSTYPFDYKDVQIKLLHPSFNDPKLNRPVILIPDLDSYRLINPKITPGVDEKIILDGWILDSSFFEYEFHSYNTNYGFHNSRYITDFPELSFTIVLKRQFINPLIARIAPLLLVVTLLFTLLLIANQENAIDVLVACAGLIFVVVLDQVAVRGEIIASGIVYLEYFYFLIYLYILLITINAIFLSKQYKDPLIQYLFCNPDKPIVKIIYWPSLLSILLIITILIFY